MQPGNGNAPDRGMSMIMMELSTHQSTDWPTNQIINQPINQLINQPTNQSQKTTDKAISSIQVKII